VIKPVNKIVGTGNKVKIGALSRDMKLNNNLIFMRFMGIKTGSPWASYYSISMGHCACREKTRRKTFEGFASVAKYVESWDWLMPVYSKCLKVRDLPENAAIRTVSASFGIFTTTPMIGKIDEWVRSISLFASWAMKYGLVPDITNGEGVPVDIKEINIRRKDWPSCKFLDVDSIPDLEIPMFTKKEK